MSREELPPIKSGLLLCVCVSGGYVERSQLRLKPKAALSDGRCTLWVFLYVLHHSSSVLPCLLTCVSFAPLVLSFGTILQRTEGNLNPIWDLSFFSHCCGSVLRVLTEGGFAQDHSLRLWLHDAGVVVVAAALAVVAGV